MKRAKKIPDWFHLDQYAQTEHFGAADWSFMLHHRIRYQGLARVTRQNFDWGLYLDEVLPSRYSLRKQNENFDPLSDLPLFEGIRDVTNVILAGAEEREALAEIDVRMWGNQILMVDLSTPDPQLRKAFDRWLLEHRKQAPLGLKRRGPKAANVFVSPNHLKIWTEHKVLAIFDLDLWAQVSGEPEIASEYLGDLLLSPGQTSVPGMGHLGTQKTG